MSSDAFARALAFTLGPEIEGGVSNHPLDFGGLTYNGFTQRTYDSYRLAKKLAKRSVMLIEDFEKAEIAREFFWVSCNCDALPDNLAIVVFDMAINSGPWPAKQTLQRALRIPADGVIGMQTIAAAKATPDAVMRFLEARGSFIAQLVSGAPTQAAFLGGWIKRLLRQASLFGGDTNG